MYTETFFYLQWFSPCFVKRGFIFAPILLLSCQPRVTVVSYFVYKPIRDLESTDHLFINPICRIELYTSHFSIRVSSSEVYMIVLNLAIVNKIYVTVTFGWHYSRQINVQCRIILLCTSIQSILCKNNL